MHRFRPSSRPIAATLGSFDLSVSLAIDALVARLDACPPWRTALLLHARKGRLERRAAAGKGVRL